MNNNLTNTQIARVFAMYWGCSVQVKETFYWEKIKWERGDVIGNYLNTGGIHIAITNTFLRLTPLSAISDEDAIEVCKWFGCDDAKILVKTSDYFVYETKEYEHPQQETFYYTTLKWEQYQYLIQKGYAVPIFVEVGHPDNGKTAIDLGIAISRTELHKAKECDATDDASSNAV